MYQRMQLKENGEVKVVMNALLENDTIIMAEDTRKPIYDCMSRIAETGWEIG